MLPWTCFTKNLDLFLIELMFHWAKINLPSLINFKNLTQPLYLPFSKDISKLLSTFKIPRIFPLFCHVATLKLSLVNILSNIHEPLLFKCSLCLLRGRSFIIFDLSIKNRFFTLLLLLHQRNVSSTPQSQSLIFIKFPAVELSYYAIT